MTTSRLPDVQDTSPHSPLWVNAVGVSHLRHPIVVLDRARAKQETVAAMTMSVDLEATRRGAHLSRFVELMSQIEEFTVRTGARLLSAIRTQLGSTQAMVAAEFPYFIEKTAPVTGTRGLLDVNCYFSFEGSPTRADFLLSVTVPVTTLCPCSKAISDYGAHNQRCDVTISIRHALVEDPADDEVVWIEELVELAERNSSAPIYSALKRADERAVTMWAFDHPAFVEDVVRDIAVDLMNDSRAEAFCVEASSHESIHNHRAFARIGEPLR